MDNYRVSYHGYAHSHIDALCHILYKEQTYNGYATADVNTAKGCTKLGIDNLKQGVITRGILIDIPRLSGVPYLEPGTPVYVEDIEAWEKKAGVKIGPGDAILLRTGRWARREKVGPVDGRPQRRRLPRLGGAVDQGARRGLCRQRCGAGRRAVDGRGHRPCPVHTLLLTGPRHQPARQPGSRSASAATAARLNRWEFMLTIAPLVVTGGTGSPANILATF